MRGIFANAFHRLADKSAIEVLLNISVALLFFLVPRTGFGGGAGAFSALVVAGRIRWAE